MGGRGREYSKGDGGPPSYGRPRVIDDEATRLMSPAEQRRAAATEDASDDDKTGRVDAPPVSRDDVTKVRRTEAEASDGAPPSDADAGYSEIEDALEEERTAVIRPGAVNRRALPFRKVKQGGDSARDRRASDGAAGDSSGAMAAQAPGDGEPAPRSLWSATPTVDPNALPSALAPTSVPPQSLQASTPEGTRDAIWIIAALLLALAVGFAAVVVLARM